FTITGVNDVVEQDVVCARPGQVEHGIFVALASRARKDGTQPETVRLTRYNEGEANDVTHRSVPGTSAVGPFVERYADAGTESGVFGIVAGRAAETQPGPFFVVGELALNAGARVDAILETIPPASDAR